jgi:WD40 repeat protein
MAVESSGAISIRTVEDGKEVKSLTSKPRLTVHDFIDNDRTFIYQDVAGKVYQASTTDFTAGTPTEVDKQVKVACLDPTLQYISWVNGDNEVQIFDLKAGMTAGRVPANSIIKKCSFIGYDRFGQQLAAISDQGEAFAYNPLNQKLLRQLKLQSGEFANSQSIIHSVATNSGGDRFLIGLQEVFIPKGASQKGITMERRNMIVVYDWVSGTEIKRVPLRYRVDGMALGPGANHVSYYSEDSRTINLLNLEKSEVGSSVAVDEKPTAIALSDDGLFLAVGTAKGVVNLYEVVRNDPPDIKISKPGIHRGYGEQIVTAPVLVVEGTVESKDKVSSVFVNGEKANFDFVRSFSHEVNLSKGKNKVTVTVQNTQAVVTEKDFYVTYEPKEAAATVSKAGGTGTSGKRLALVIGNAEYASTAKLRNTRNDASSMAVELQALGFEVLKVLDGSYEQMKNALYAFGDKVEDVDVAVFFYAGHGLEVDGVNYLVPVDASIQSALDVKQKALPLTGVIRTMEFANDEGLNMIILDACRNNPFPTGKRSSGSGLARVQTPSGTLIAYSTDPGSVASDGDRDNGLYTGELIKQLRVSQRIEDVFMKTRNEVELISKGAQRPWEEARLKGVFYLK